MLTRGINKEFDKHTYSYGTQPEVEIRLKSMISSCFAYGSCKKGSYNFSTYIEQYIEELGEELFEEVYAEQCNYLETHCTIQHGTYTDSDGCSYNTIIHT